MSTSDNFFAEEADFSQAEALYSAGFGSTSLTRRWKRIREEIPFEDVVAELTGDSRQKINCPFHGVDSTPSFQVYRNNNSGWCFGCPPGAQHQWYDAVKFVAAKFAISRTDAIGWLEKHYELPPLPDEEETGDQDEDDDSDSDYETVSIVLTFDDLREHYIKIAATDFQANDCDPELLDDYRTRLFNSMPNTDRPLEGDEALEALLPMARVLGSVALDRIAQSKYKG